MISTAYLIAGLISALCGGGAVFGLLRWIGRHAVKDAVREVLKPELDKMSTSVAELTGKVDSASMAAAAAAIEAKSSREELQAHMQREEADIAADVKQREERQSDLNRRLSRLEDGQDRIHERIDESHSRIDAWLGGPEVRRG